MENFPAPLDTILKGGGQEGIFLEGVHGAVRAGSGGVYRNWGGKAVPILGGHVLEAFILPALRADAAQVAVLHQKVVRGDGVLGLSQKASVFRDHALSGEDHILGGLGKARGAVGVNAVQAPGLMANHIPAVGGLAYGLIGSGQVQDHLRAAEGQKGGGRDGRPQILTNFDSQGHGLSKAEQSLL